MGGLRNYSVFVVPRRARAAGDGNRIQFYTLPSLDDNPSKASGRSLPPVIAKLLTALPTLPLHPHGTFGFEKRQTGDVSSWTQEHCHVE